MDDRERLIILNMVQDLGSKRTQNLLKYFGSLEKIFEADEAQFKEVKDIGPAIAPRIYRSIRETNLNRELKLIKKHRVKVITFLDEDYPKNLKHIYDPPIVLYIKGEILPQDDIAVAIVGSRLASFYGIQTSERLGFELASRGITIVSGLARGIDSNAHRGALKAKGRTLAVLGSGLAHIYPEEHIFLSEEISEAGAVISEFPMVTIPDRGNFPKRNRIISGLSLGVVVVEASERSGALITSECAAEQGREVFAVPGKVDSVTSRGTHKLIKQGAKLAETVDDILEELRLETTISLSPVVDRRVASSSKRGERVDAVLDKDETLVYNLLSSEPKHIDELAEESGMDISDISKVLLSLEIRRLARQLPGKNFVVGGGGDRYA